MPVSCPRLFINIYYIRVSEPELPLNILTFLILIILLYYYILEEILDIKPDARSKIHQS